MNHAITQNSIDPLQGQRRVRRKAATLPHHLAMAGEPRAPFLSDDLTRAVKAPLNRKFRHTASRGDGGCA
ncbi:MAG: hypothetical protein RQM90_07600 [Methanoculleus sp.]